MAHRHYRKEVTRIPRPADSWFELAPLGRSWYEVLRPDGTPSPVVDFHQHFDPLTAVLDSTVHFADTTARVTTFLHARLPLLVVRSRFDRDVRVRTKVAAGPWSPSDDEPDPFSDLSVQPGEIAAIRYRLGALVGEQALWLDLPPDGIGGGERGLTLERACRAVTLFHAIVDDRDRTTMVEVIGHARTVGFDGLLAEHTADWGTYRQRSSINVPDPELQRLYDAGLTLFRAIQSPTSGGIPVGLLRQTWSSHLFWDAYFPSRALLEANQVEAARAQCGFLLRTADQAREHARQTFGVDGLAWDWELTHDGRRAYGQDWGHLAEQVHNTAAYSNLLFDTWSFAQDRAFLRSIDPVLTGIAEFFRQAVVEQRREGWGTRALVGVHESALRVRDDAFNLAGAIRALRNAALAQVGVHADAERPRQYWSIAEALERTLHGLYDGRMFRSYAHAPIPTMSSLAPIWPMQLVRHQDRRARSTARAFRRAPGFLTAGGWPRSVWPAAILARVFAGQRRGDDAVDILRRCRPAMNIHGGVAERVDEDGHWNLQYFATAHGALCSAIHAMLLSDEGGIEPFPAVPSSWRRAAFDRLLVDGLEVSATLEDGRLTRLEVGNATAEDQVRTVRVGRRARKIALRPGEWQAVRT